MRHLALVGLVGFACSSPASLSLRPQDHRARARLPVVEDTRVVLGAMGGIASEQLRVVYGKQADLLPPVQLVPTDGSELGLEELRATVDLDGPLARTEFHLVFRNTEARQREGRFSLVLPATASVSRFGMKIAGEWREARIVSRAKGREVYEAILKQRRDPALLERDLGNQFSARVFPIAAHERKEIAIAYEHVVSEAQPYRLALRGLPVVPTLVVDIAQDGARASAVQSGQPPEDVLLPVARRSTAIAAGDAFVARLEAPPTAAAAPLDRVLVLVDTSASRTTVMGRQGQAVRAVLAALRPDAEVAVAAYDHQVTELYRGPARGAELAISRLYDVGALGASDLGGALAYAARAGMPRVILVGDGMATLGVREPAKLAALLRGASASAGERAPTQRIIERIDALQVGETIDRDALGPIVAAGATPGAILDGRDLERATRQLAAAVGSERRIAVAGATTWPATTRGVAPGDPVWVFGRRTGAGPLRVEIGAQVITVAPTSAHDSTRVTRAVAAAQVAAMTEQLARLTDGPQKRALATELEKLALAHGLVSQQTSLIVLESAADEQRFLGPPPADTEPEHTAMHDTRFDEVLGSAAGEQGDGGGEVIRISGSAPAIDSTSTAQGITINHDYIRNVPLQGRTFEGVVVDGAVNLSGSTSVENVYIADSTTVRSRSRGAFQVKADVMSPLANELVARSIAAGGMVPDDPEDEESAATTDAPAEQQREVVWSQLATPHEGTYLAVREAIAADDRERALATASAAELANPGDITNVLALGEALEARGAYALAARAYGSLVDLYPNRAELLRAAGQRLDALADRFPAARDLAIDAYRRALAERPDHAHTYRLLALSLLLANRSDTDAEVLPTLAAGIARASETAVSTVLSDDRAVAQAVLAARHPEHAAEYLGAQSSPVSRQATLRIVLAWETDANDVDLHVLDRAGDEAYYAHPALPSGGMLLQDITRGWGPEMFTIVDPRAFPYRVAVHYYSRGPMGVGLGTVQAVRHDGKGHITVQQSPFVIQTDQALVELPAIR